jgi:hypothetical protein
MKPGERVGRITPLRRTAGMGPRGALVHRSQIVLGMLVIIFRGDPIAASGFGLCQCQVTVIVSTRILRRLGLGAVEFGRIGVLPRPFRHSSRHCVGFHFSVRQRLRCCSIFRGGCHSAPWAAPAKAARHSFEKMAGCVDGALRQGDRTSMAPAGNELGARKIEALAENVPVQLHSIWEGEPRIQVVRRLEGTRADARTVKVRHARV